MGARQNENRDGLMSLTLTASTVASASTEEYTFTAQGLRVGDFVQVNKPTRQAGLGIAHARVPANDQIAITYINALPATAVTPTAAEAYLIYWHRAERTPGSVIA